MFVLRSYRDQEMRFGTRPGLPSGEVVTRHLSRDEMDREFVRLGIQGALAEKRPIQTAGEALRNKHKKKSVEKAKESQTDRSKNRGGSQ